MKPNKSKVKAGIGIGVGFLGIFFGLKYLLTKKTQNQNELSKPLTSNLEMHEVNRDNSGDQNNCPKEVKHEKENTDFISQYTKTITHYDEAIRLKSDEPEYYNYRGNARYHLKRYDTAIQDYNEAVRLQSKEAVYYSNRGNAKCLMQQYEEAIKDYDEAILLHPKKAVYYHRGNAKTALKQYVEAIQDYSKAIKIDADYLQAYENRAALYEQLGGEERLQLAQNDRARIVALKNRNEPCRRLFDAIKQGQKKQAIECLDALKKEKPDGLPITMSDNGTQEPALLTLARYGHTDWLDSFLEHMRINLIDAEGNTLLHIAATHGHLDFCRALINKGIMKGRAGGGYIWPQNQKGQTPLHLAALGGQAALIVIFAKEYLAEEDLQIPAANGDTLIHLLARHRHVEAIRTLLKTFPYLSVRTLNAYQHDALSEAVEVEDINVLTEILKHQVDLSNRDNDGRTTLHLAVQKNNLGLVQALVEKGASLEVCDRFGKKPGDYVAKDSRIDVWLTNQGHAKRPRQHFNQQFFSYKNLIFQGGSVKGLAYPNAMRTAEELGIFKLANIKRVGGTSAGAITALLVGLGYSCDEIDHIMGVKTLQGSDLPQIKFSEFLDGEFGEKLLAAKNKDWGKLLGEEHNSTLQRLQTIDTGWVALARLLDGTAIKTAHLAFDVKNQLLKVYQQLNREFALCPGEKLRKLFDDLIRRKLSEKAGYPITTEVTFADLAKYSDFKELYFVGVNLETGEHEVFSQETSPHMVVADAVRISMSIPGVFYPHPKVIKKPNGELDKSKALYTDGGLLWNYPIELFDFTRFGKEKIEKDKKNFEDMPQINYETLGFRLVSSASKKRYESSLNIEQTGINDPVTLWEHIKSLIEITASKQQESVHLRQGDSRRTVYIDVLDVGTLDFERVEELSTKKALMQQGREGVLDFQQRMQTNALVEVELPEALIKKIQEHSKVGLLTMQNNQHTIKQQVTPNCPELVLEFYKYGDARLHVYLHHSLGISLWTRDDQGNTVFHCAVKQREKAALKRLLSVDLSGIEAVNNADETLVNLAQKGKDTDMISFLQSYQLERNRIALPSSSQISTGEVSKRGTMETKRHVEASTVNGAGSSSQMLPQYTQYTMSSAVANGTPDLLPIRESCPVSLDLQSQGNRGIKVE